VTFPLLGISSGGIPRDAPTPVTSAPLSQGGQQRSKPRAVHDADQSSLTPDLV
jgi:hypothetical protein